MKIVVPKETAAGEARAATTPEVVKKLIKLGFEVAVEAGLGKGAKFSDLQYTEAGAEVLRDTEALWKSGDIVLKVLMPNETERSFLKAGQTLISFFWPAQNEDILKQLADKKITVLAMDSVPRISRAQKLDALSSMANIAGYRAVVEASHHFGRFFTGSMTAAGKVPPAKVMVIGAGVAGLAAIGQAASMGAIVRAFDTRPEVKEQVESMGAEFLDLDYEEEKTAEGPDSGYAKVMSKAFIDAEMALFREQAKEVDIIITTALIPGRPAPKLILADMVELMKEGSVIVDLAAEQGGNCELTEPGQAVVKHGVTLIGFTDLVSRLATQSSQLYASNLHHLLSDLTPNKDGIINVDMEDDVIRGTTICKDGEVTWPAPAISVSAAPKTEPKIEIATIPPVDPAIEKEKKAQQSFIGLMVVIAFIIFIGAYAPAAFMGHFIVFVLAVFVGWQVVWSVSASLHTPLMSVTNAISGIVVVGAVLQVNSSSNVVVALSAVAILIATINISGGFLVTQRMLKMFSK